MHNAEHIRLDQDWDYCFDSEKLDFNDLFDRTTLKLATL